MKAWDVLAQNVKTRRINHTWTPLELAVRAGMSEPRLIAIERGDPAVTLDELARLASALWPQEPASWIHDRIAGYMFELLEPATREPCLIVRATGRPASAGRSSSETR